MTTEEIVRALAAADLAPGGDSCRLCGPAGFEPESVADHEPDCPWRLAVEWVAAQEREAPQTYVAAHERTVEGVSSTVLPRYVARPSLADADAAALSRPR